LKQTFNRQVPFAGIVIVGQHFVTLWQFRSFFAVAAKAAPVEMPTRIPFFSGYTLCVCKRFVLFRGNNTVEGFFIQN
jgi:hypothetical protein